MCYNKNNPNLKKYCGPDWVYCHWPSANITSFEDTKNQIILESNKYLIIDKVGWFGNIYSPMDDVIEHKTRPLLHLFTFQTPILTAKKIKKCKINSRNFTYDGLTFSSSGFILEEVKDEI